MNNMKYLPLALLPGCARSSDAIVKDLLSGPLEELPVLVTVNEFQTHLDDVTGPLWMWLLGGVVIFLGILAIFGWYEKRKHDKKIKEAYENHEWERPANKPLKK